MRILLINSNRLKHPWPVIPFGLCYVASSLESAGHEVRVLDLCFTENPTNEIERLVPDFKPDVVGIGIRNLDNCTAADQKFHPENVRKEVVVPLKKVFKGPIIIGGPAVGINGAELLEFLELEYAIRGDGELAICGFLKRLERDEPLENLEGLVIRRNGKLVVENEPLRPTDLDSLPPPDIWRYLDLEPYKKFESPIQVQTKRGCELGCTYCTYNLIEGKRYRLRNPEKVADEIEMLVKKTGVKHIEFTDSTFNIPLDHTKSILRAIAKKDLQLEIRTMGLNPSAVDGELVGLMQTAGFRDVDFSVEAGCDEMLKALGKNFRREDILRSAELLHSKGIAILWFLLLGAPGETRATLRETFDTLDNAVAPWDFVDIALGVRVYKGSPIARKLQRANPGITADNFLKPFSLPLEGMDIPRLRKIIKRETFRHDNYYLYGDITNFNPLVRRVITVLLKTLVPQQPFWRFYIFVKKVQRFLGVTAIQSVMFDIKNKGEL